MKSVLPKRGSEVLRFSRRTPVRFVSGVKPGSKGYLGPLMDPNPPKINKSPLAVEVKKKKFKCSFLKC